MSHGGDVEYMKEKQKNTVILDFTHIYPPDEIQKFLPNVRLLDLSDIQETDMYCSPHACRQLKIRLSGIGPEGIHFLDNGNYHYVTRLFTEKITCPYTLFLFDHHTDMQKPLVSGLLSCGSWARDLLMHDPNLMQLILIGPRSSQIRELPDKLKEKLLYISGYELQRNTAQDEFRRIQRQFPAYISIDKDVLSSYFARTNWNQGNMSLPLLKYLIKDIFDHVPVIGADICGEASLAQPLSELAEDIAVNRSTDDILYRFLCRLMQSAEK